MLFTVVHGRPLRVGAPDHRLLGVGVVIPPVQRLEVDWRQLAPAGRVDLPDNEAGSLLRLGDRGTRTWSVRSRRPRASALASLPLVMRFLAVRLRETQEGPDPAIGSGCRRGHWWPRQCSHVLTLNARRPVVFDLAVS